MGRNTTFCRGLKFLQLLFKAANRRLALFRWLNELVDFSQSPLAGRVHRSIMWAKLRTLADYVRFSQYEDALASFELVALMAPLVRDKPQYWKWVIVSAHNALQSAMVCAYADITTGDSTGTSVLTEKSAEKVLAWLSTATPGLYPKERLADFPELLKRCVAGKPNFEPLVLTPKQHKDIERLHDVFRNNFVHFTPKGWSIQKAGLPRIICAALDAAEELMHRSYVSFQIDDDQQKRLTDALAVARKHLSIT
jgi:hypothetical protein